MLIKATEKEKQCDRVFDYFHTLHRHRRIKKAAGSRHAAAAPATQWFATQLITTSDDQVGDGWRGLPLMNSSCGTRRGAWQVQAVLRTKSGPVESKQTHPLSKARPELRSPMQFLLLPLDGERRCPNFKTPVASLRERWCVFLACDIRRVHLTVLAARGKLGST
jgi:hypothetical protein